MILDHLLHIRLCVFSAILLLFFFFVKQKTAYEMRISDWSSDVCSSDLPDQECTPPAETAVSIADLRPGEGNCGTPALYIGHRLSLQPTPSVAARNQREHNGFAAAILPKSQLGQRLPS